LEAEATNDTPKSPKRARRAAQKDANGTNAIVAETISAVVEEDAVDDKLEKAEGASTLSVRRTRRRGAAAS
jgi:hypothetical protein